jgi:hypothetical protein
LAQAVVEVAEHDAPERARDEACPERRERGQRPARGLRVGKNWVLNTSVAAELAITTTTSDDIGEKFA